MEELKKRLYNKAKEQNNYLLKLVEALRLQGKSHDQISKNKNYSFERDKQIGHLNMLDIAGIERTEFNWIF